MNKLIITTPIGSFIIKHSDDSFRILEEKKEPTAHGALVLEPTLKNFKQLYEGVSTALAPYLPELRKRNLALTKKAIKDSLTTDTLLIQTTQSIGEIAKAANLMMKRLREWAGYTLPEFVQRTESHEALAKALATTNRAALLKKMNLREEESMGAVLADEDLTPIKELAQQLHELLEARKKLEIYLEKMMRITYPNVYAVAGSTIGAKLLAKAGSLKRLSRLPASTVQLLGAEKAFFRHLKTGARQPKYGLLFEHELMSKVAKKNRGKMARCLADKISIAAKVDYFRGVFVGDQLKKQVEKKFTGLKGEGK